MNNHVATGSRKKIISATLNIILVGFLLLMIFSPTVKGWVLSGVVATGLFNARVEKDNKTGVEVSNFIVQDASGNQVSTEALRGKRLFINFWASWCPPCRAEMPSITRMYEELKSDTNLLFLFISEDDNLQKASDYLNKNQFDIPLFKIASTVPREIYSGKLPTTTVLDQEGRMIYHHESMADYDTKEFKNLLTGPK